MIPLYEIRTRIAEAAAKLPQFYPSMDEAGGDIKLVDRVCWARKMFFGLGILAGMALSLMAVAFHDVATLVGDIQLQQQIARERSERIEGRSVTPGRDPEPDTAVRPNVGPDYPEKAFRPGVAPDPPDTTVLPKVGPDPVAVPRAKPDPPTVRTPRVERAPGATPRVESAPPATL